jgi:gluconate 2-dehydrogenase gamma chain
MISRRDILFAGAAFALIPSAANALYTKPVSIYKAPYQTIAIVYGDLFPSKGSAPSTQLLHSIDYLGGVMKDPYVDEDTKRFILGGAGWLDEASQKAYGKPYYRLEPDRRQHVLNDIVGKTWGDNWLWTLFSYLFESLLCDPVYGANTHEAGWHWLDFTPGYPRPKAPVV